VESLAILGGHAVRTSPFTPWPLFSDKEDKNIEKLRDLDHKAIRNQRLSYADRES
jgi:hypothetical protein